MAEIMAEEGCDVANRTVMQSPRGESVETEKQQSDSLTV